MRQDGSNARHDLLSQRFGTTLWHILSMAFTSEFEGTLGRIDEARARD